jgi:flagellar assembly protein FliH
MAAVQKFMFDTEFFDEVVEETVEPEAPPEPSYSQSELDAACAASRADGRAQALQEAATADGRLAADALDVIGKQLATLREMQDAALDEAKRGAVAIAAAIAGKIAPELLHAGAVDSIAALVAERLPELMDEPRIVVRLDTALLDLVKARLDATAKRVGFNGQFILLAEDGLNGPDCRIEWADGGTERIVPRVAAEIEKIVARFLSDSSH